MTEISDIDLNLRAIKRFESTGSMPALPDMVKLDLAASSGLGPEGTVEFLGGLSRDIMEPLASRTNQIASSVAQPKALKPINSSTGYSVSQKINMFGRATANLKAPTELTGSQAVIDWKRRAIRGGYLAEEDVELDNRWDPSYNSIGWQMNQDDFNRRMRGNSPAPGASINQMLETFDDWLSPTGLITAAVGMGFLPDVDMIGSEWDRWKKEGFAFSGLRDAFTPGRGGTGFTGFFKDVWRALGPVDDVLMPVINIALLFTGVGEVAAFSRATMLATKGISGTKSWQLAQGVGRAGRIRTGVAGTRFGRVTGMSSDIGADINRMSQGGLIAGRIFPGAERAAELAARGKNIGNVRKTLGGSMTGWRNLRGVMVAKKSVQKGMQLGFVNRVEQAFGYNPELLPGQETVLNFSEDMRRNPLVWGMGEALFTPTAILQPGQIKKPFGWINKFEKVGQNAFYSDEFNRAHEFKIMNDEIAGVTPEAARVQREQKMKAWQQEVKTHGVSQALANEYANGDLKKMGAFTTWIATMSAIDGQAAAMTAVSKGTDVFIENALRFEHGFHMARNKIINQIRYIDPDDIEGVIHLMAFNRARNAKQAQSLVVKYTDMIANNPARVDTLKKFIEAHNAKRQGILQDLLAKFIEKPGVLSNAIADHLDKFGKFDDFVDGMDEVNDTFRLGNLGQAQAKVPVNPLTGMPLKSQPVSLYGPKAAPHHVYGRPDPEIGFMHDVQDVLDDPEFIDFYQKGFFDVFNKPLNPAGKFTMARVDTPTAQTKRVEIATIKRLNVIGQTVRDLRKVPEDVKRHSKLVAELAGTGNLKQVLANVSAKQLDAALQKIGMSNDMSRRYRRLLKYAKEHKIGNFEDISKNVAKRLDDIDNSAHWSNTHGINSSLSLDMKVKALIKQVAYTATEVDVSTIPPALAAKLEKSGYKLVHGVEFAAPEDLRHLAVEFKDLVNKTKYDDSLGTLKLSGAARKVEEGAIKGARGLYRSTQRWEPDLATSVYRAAYKNALHKAMFNLDEGGRTYKDIGGADLNTLMDDLQDTVHEVADQMIEMQLKKDDYMPFSLQRAWTNAQSSFTPAAPADLARNPTIWSKRVLPKLEDKGYTAKEISRIYDALKQSRVVGPEIRGRFTNMFDKIQSNNQLTSALRSMGTSQYYLQTPGKIAPNILGKAGRLTATTALHAGVQSRYNKANDMEWHEFDGHKTMTALLTGLGVRGISGALMRRIWTKAGGNVRQAEHIIKKWNLPSLHGLANKVDDSTKFKRWAYLGDAAATARDYFRFSLSPIFDASRYTEGMVLAQIGDVPEEVVARGGLRFNISPTTWKKGRMKELTGSRKLKNNSKITVYGDPEAKSLAQQRLYTADELRMRGLDPDKFKSHQMNAKDVVKHEWNVAVNEFSAIGKRRHDFDYEALEAGTARFRQVGILGFNTQEWMASMYADLTRLHGIDSEKAYDIARKAFTYGVKPRSGMEMNVNAVFFPFSFTKKTFGHAAKFMSQDWSRAAMIHDAAKSFEILNEEYDLNDMWKDHLPALTKLYRLNPFAFGMTMGEFGGANRPFINFIGGTTAGLDIDPIFNVFLPQGHDIRDDKDMFEIEATYKRLAPVFNDMAHMLESVKEQGRVIVSDSHLTTTAEVQAGYEERSELREDVDRAMKARGFANGIGDIRKKAAGEFNTYLKVSEQEIRDKYPAFAEAYADSISNSVMKQQEISALKRSYEAFVTENGRNVPPTTRETKMGYLLAMADHLIDQAGGVEYVSSKDIYYLMKRASSWAKDDNYIRIKWRSLLRSNWGPIETELI